MRAAFAPFTPQATSAKLSATTSSSRVALPGNASQYRIRTDAGDAVVYLQFGDATVTASTSTSMAVGPGMAEVISVPLGATYVAGITAATTATVYITPGEGV